MLFIPCTLLNPLSNDFFFCICEAFVRFGWRHHLPLLPAADSQPSFALFDIPGNNRSHPVDFRCGTLNRIKSQVRLAGLRIKTMAGKTLVREYRPHIPIVGNIPG